MSEDHVTTYDSTPRIRIAVGPDGLKALNTVSLPGGGTRSEIKPGYHMVPAAGPRRTAQRFSLGAAKHGESNWLRSMEKPSWASAFCKEAFNHMLDHAFKMSNGLELEDDHLGAIGWAQAVLAYAEDRYNCAWTEIERLPDDEVPF